MSKKGNNKRKCIAVSGNHYGAKRYFVCTFNEKGDYNPQGCLKSAHQLYPFIDGRTITHITSCAKEDLLKRASPQHKKVIKRLDILEI